MTLNQTIIEELENEYNATLEVVSHATDNETVDHALKELEQLHKQLMDYKKLEFEHEQKALDRLAKTQEYENEKALKGAELVENKKNRIVTLITTGVTAFGTIGGMILTNKWLTRTMSFEETGTFTSKSISFVQGVKRLFGNKG